MRLNNNERIITDDDIIMSDGSKSLSDVLSSQQKQISSLMSNLKWIYKYGGVGGSGGGGGGTTQSFSIFASLNGIQLKDQSIVLDGAKIYPLSIRINNPNGAQFNVKYAYTTKSATGGDIKQEQTVILSIENNYTFETQLNLNMNSTLQITVSDGNETKQVMCSYVVSPYEFTLSLVDNDGNAVSNEHFIETAAAKGVNVKLDYVISIPATISYNYTFLEDTQSGSIEDKNNSILFPIDPSLFDPSNAGYYTANIDFNIIPDGQDLVTLNKNISFSLIPGDLYMLIQPQTGIMYDNNQVESPYEYTPGYLTFDYRIYEGISQNRTYTVDIKLNGTSIVNQSVTERQQQTFKLFSVTPGANTLEITVSRATTYKKTYYFYIQESTLSLDWFDKPSEWLSYYYRINEVTDNFAAYKDKLYISQTVNSSPITISGLNAPNVSANALVNTHIAIGLQYNTINSEDPTIFNFYNSASGTSPVLSIQQSQVTRQGQFAALYIRKQANVNKDNVENYHLISIYSQFVKRVGNDFYYEISLYIDGILESVFGQITSVPLLLTSLSLEPVNCFVNLLEVDYKETDESTHSNCDYDVYKFFLKYKNAILRQDVGNELLLLDYVKNFNVNLNGRVTLNQADISNIAKNISTPVLLMTYQDDGQFDNMGGFMESLEAGYGEDGTGLGSDMNFQVTVAWGSGNNSVDDIQFPSGFETARFRASLQGSSTKMYRVKNFNLSIENTAGTEEDDIYLYSPNFEDGNNKTFLPETEFTLKADVVDSSHSNNTSCGRFINTVCRKFSNDISDDGHYKDYIKNCLDGFPTLLFLCHVKQDPITQEVTNTYYYLGVYNFNLGRTSYYNLGYKDLSIFGDNENKLLSNAGNSFTFFKISPSENTLKQGLGVAEIQGGDPHFDFSQYDPTVLFQQDPIDSRYMFGDIVYGSNGTEQQLKTTISNFVQKVAKSGGYLFDFLKKKRGKYETSDITEGAGYTAEVYVDGQPTGESKNQVPDYTKQYEKYLSPGGAWKFREKQTISPGTQLDLQDLIIPDVDSGKQASLNFQSISEYYTICMVLGLVDSVMKNLNIKTWNAKPDGTATWYPAFYDMDTCLGINNQGNPISYFAFSDYWHSQITKTVNEVEYPSSVRVYKDFSPHSLGENGYDVPTNFLFTVAKYSKLIFSDNTSEQAIYLSQYPQELYAKWRSNTINSETNEGILKNADSFMNNFFANNLAAICPALVSYNYRSKYLKLANEGDTVWVATDFNKFNGTRVNKVRDWLDGRLHILDVYFNLNRQMPQAITYRTDAGTWETLMNGSAPVTDAMYVSNFDLTNNDDVVILKDIFSANGGSGVQLSGFTSFQIRCPEFSPLQIYNQIGSIHENYILGGDKNQQVEFTATGNQAIKLGGSQAWTYLQDINWIKTSGLYITSDKLENITGNSGSFTSLQLVTPNVKTISLTSPNYSGGLSLNGTDNYPNLSEINISNSQINLTANNLNVKIVNISNMNAENSEVTITNCGSITSLNTTNVRLRQLHVEGLKGSLKNFTLSGTNINQIIVKGGETGGTFTLTNDQTVTSVTIGDFQKVVIQNCPKLTSITINQKIIQDVEELRVSNCQASGIAITSEASSTAGKVTLRTSKVKRVYFKDTVGITDVELPDGTTLLANCFQNCRNLETVTGNTLYLNSGVFNICPKYALRNSSGSYTGLTVASSTTSLNSAFRETNVTWEEVKQVINTIIPSSNSITNVAYLFSYCSGITFNQEDLKNSITNSDYPNFSKLSKVTDASYFFYNPTKVGVCAINKNFMAMGSTAGCNYTNAFCSSDSLSQIFVPKNVFEGTIGKITYLPFGNNNNITFTDEQGNALPTSEDIMMSEIFNPGGVSPSKLITMRNVEPYGSYTFDWTGTFTAAWSKLTGISNVCGKSCRYKGYENLFKDVPNALKLSESFNASQIAEATADYYTMFNWDKLVTQDYIFGLDYTRHEGAYSNGCKKYISADNYNLLCEKILKSTTLNRIDAIFRNVEVIGSLGDWTFGTTVNTRIKKAALAFDRFANKTSLESSTLNNLNLSTEFCRTLPALENVMGMFRGCKFGKPIPFNFFKKRNEQIESVWVKVGESYNPATLYTYSYSQLMYDMSHLFENCEFSQTSLQYDPSLYTIKKARVTDGSSEYQEYYTRTTIPPEEEGGDPTYAYVRHQLEQVTEVSDAENLVGGYIANVVGTSITNPSINGDPNKLIVPPDLFYGLKSNVTSSTDYSQGVYLALACSTPLNGIIPANLLKNSKTVRCDYLWKGQTIIPRKIATWASGSTTYNVYVHFPSGYTNYGSLDNAFNGEYIVLADETSGGTTTVNYSLVLLQDSIPQITTSLANAFAGQNRWPYLGYGLPTNITPRFNFIGKLNGESLIQGLDPSHFTQLNMNNLFRSNYMGVVNGELFVSSFDAGNLKMSNTTDKVISIIGALLGPEVTDAISRNVILPKASRAISQLGNTGYKIRSSQITNSSTSKNFYTQAGWTVVD